MKKWNYFAFFLPLGILYANRLTLLTILFPIDYYDELSATYAQDIIADIGISIPLTTPLVFMALFLKWHYKNPEIDILKFFKGGITKTNLTLWIIFLIISTSAISLHFFAPLHESEQEMQVLEIFTAIFILLIYSTLNVLANYLQDPESQPSKKVKWITTTHYFLIYPLATGFILFFLSAAITF